MNDHKSQWSEESPYKLGSYSNFNDENFEPAFGNANMFNFDKSEV